MNTVSNLYNAELKEVLKKIKHRIWQRIWRSKNPEKVKRYRETQKQDRRGNPAFLKHVREYRHANPEKVKKWNNEYKEKWGEAIQIRSTQRYHETSTYYQCGCGSVIKHMTCPSVTKYKITRHEGSKKHQKWVTSTP